MKFKVILKGRLGNQMFQYAFARALSEYHNAELHIKEPPRNYMLGKIFGIQSTMHESIEWNKSFVEHGGYDPNNLKKYFTSIIDDNYSISGYWQNEGYFKKYEALFRKIYYVEPIKLDDNDLIMHVRRGDYVTNEKYFCCDLNWHKRAISQFNFTKLYILSDDPEWCEKNFYRYDPIILRTNELNSLRYMAGAKNIIIPNSTFSWWGAWLSNTENVICPKLWLPCNHWKVQRKIWRKLK